MIDDFSLEDKLTLNILLYDSINEGNNYDSLCMSELEPREYYGIEEEIWERIFSSNSETRMLRGLREISEES